MLNFFRNPDEDQLKLRERILLGNSYLIKAYILDLSRQGVLKEKDIAIDLNMAMNLFKNNPSLSLEYLDLDDQDKKTARLIYKNNKDLTISFIKTPDIEARPSGSYGKFSLVLDSLIYHLDDDNEFFSNENWGNNARRFDLGPDSLDYLNELSLNDTGMSLTSEEMSIIVNSKGAILYESGDGFVSVNYYVSDKKLTQAWLKMEEHFYPAEEDEELDDNEENKEVE